jgi:hypothetical protein
MIKDEYVKNIQIIKLYMEDQGNWSTKIAKQTEEEMRDST